MHIKQDEIYDLLSQVPLLSHLEETRLYWLAGFFQVEFFQDGEVIFEVEESAQAMYVLYDGRVQLLLDGDTKTKTLAWLKRGDIFGEEAMLYDDPRYYQAVARGRTVLLRWSVEDYLEYDQELSEIEQRLEVAIESRELASQIDLPWLHEDEFVHVITRRHLAMLWRRILIPVILGLAASIFSIALQWQWLPDHSYGLIALVVTIIITLLWLLWSFFDWRNDYFIVTNKRVVWIEKIALIYEGRQEAPLRTIMSVGIQKSRVGSLLGFADVVVMTYVGTIRMQSIDHAETIASLIESYWRQSESRDQREEARAMAQKLHEKLDLPIREDEQTQTSSSSTLPAERKVQGKEPGFIRWLFSDFIRLRYESNGTITYRKHWFVLIKKIWLPVLLLLLSLTGFVLRLGGLLSFVPMTTGIVVLLMFMFVCFVWVVYQYADWRNDMFKVTLDQLIDIDRKPLGKVRRRAAPLENVLSIEYERLGFWGFLFNFGTVYISVGNMKLSFDHVYNPSEVQQDIFFRMGERLESVRQFQIESERERVSEWIASYHRNLERSRHLDENQNSDESMTKKI